MPKRIYSFTQLNTWKEAHKLVLMIYKITESFPERERYVLSSQMIRSAVSITSNIAEGFTRKGRNEKRQFYYLAKASLTELQNQLLIARDIKYVSNTEFKKIAKQTVIVIKLLSGLIRGISKLNS
jgi:four helix bundle protein